MPDRKIPHKAIAGLNIYVYEENSDGSLNPQAKYYDRITLLAEGSSLNECVNNVIENAKETQKAWTKKLEKK